MLDIVEKAKAILCRELNIELIALSPAKRLREDLGMDSMIALNVLFAAERELNLVISEQDIVDVVTVRDLERLIERLSATT